MFSRRTNRCSMGHIPLSPEKNEVRSVWMNELARDQDIITISHGLFDVAQSAAIFNGWRGRLFACDKDFGVRKTISFLPANPEG